MGPRIPVGKREAIQVKLAINEPVKRIAKDYNPGAKTVYKYKANLTHFGTLMRPNAPQQGCPSKISLEMEQVCFRKSSLLG